MEVGILRVAVVLAAAAVGCRGVDDKIGAVAAGGDSNTGGHAADAGGGAGGTGAVAGGATGGSGAVVSDATPDVPLDAECGKSPVHWVAGPTLSTLRQRVQFVSALKGSRALIWGGRMNGERTDPLIDGATFDLKSGEWSVTAALPGSPKAWEWFGTWSDPFLFAWGGGTDVGLYDPETDTWNIIGATGSPKANYDSQSLTSGGGAIYVWGGFDASPVPTGGRFDLAARQWSSLPLEGNPRPRGNHQAIWADSRLIVWGGWKSDGGSFSTPFEGGDIYDPGSKAWTQIPVAPADVDRRLYPAVLWTGSELIVWGGRASSGELRGDGAAYGVGAGTWRVIAPGPSARVYALVAWTGREMILYGGRDTDDAVSDETTRVWLYDPVLDRWRFELVCSPPRDAIAGWVHIYWTGSEALFVDGGGVSVNRLVGL